MEAKYSRVEGNSRAKIALMRKLARTTWEVNKQIRKSVYLGTARPTIEYSSAQPGEPQPKLINRL
jgi:hypothetical protein